MQLFGVVTERGLPNGLEGLRATVRLLGALTGLTSRAVARSLFFWVKYIFEELQYFGESMIE